MPNYRWMVPGVRVRAMYIDKDGEGRFASGFITSKPYLRHGLFGFPRKKEVDVEFDRIGKKSVRCSTVKRVRG